MPFENLSHNLTFVSSGAEISSYARHVPGSSRPILVLLHGYPQNNLMWKDFIGEVPEEYPIFVPDLPGYGLSTKPISPDSLAHSKRAWAKDILEAIDAVFPSQSPSTKHKIIPFGHDRGGRLAYRLALDFPERVGAVGVLDIVPTTYVWESMKLSNGMHRETKASWHWVFLSSPRPFPETLISSQPSFFFDTMFQRWKGPNDATTPSWITDATTPYTDPRNGPSRVAGSCEDYRAGATHDIQFDLESGINPEKPELVFTVPLLSLSSMHLRKRFDVDGIWKGLGKEGMVESWQVGGDETGHFLVNEAPREVGRRMREWLAKI